MTDTPKKNRRQDPTVVIAPKCRQATALYSDLGNMMELWNSALAKRTSTPPILRNKLKTPNSSGEKRRVRRGHIKRPIACDMVLPDNKANTPFIISDVFHLSLYIFGIKFTFAFLYSFFSQK